MNKKLPDKFVLVSPYYLNRNKYGVKVACRVKDKNNCIKWHVIETLAIYHYKGVAENMGMGYAHANGYGYIYGVKRGEYYKPAHRKAMILPSRACT